jgi:transcription antitermination factor NusG
LEGLAEEIQAVPVSVAKGLVVGERVQFVSGALKGLEGLITANADQRVMVLLELLGREVQVSADYQDIKLSH